MVKIPKPRVGDSVERNDFSRISGRVKRIVGSSKVAVAWNDGETPDPSIEKIKDLSLVGRKR